MKDIYYRQCRLEKDYGEFSLQQTSWIPDQYAAMDRKIKLKDEEGKWVDGWVVKAVGSDKIHARDLPDYRKSIRGHRKKTGDSNSVS